MPGSEFAGYVHKTNGYLRRKLRRCEERIALHMIAAEGGNRYARHLIAGQKEKVERLLAARGASSVTTSAQLEPRHV
jgi:hypothetical protein